jgi:site-specific recombinase XerC
MARCSPTLSTALEDWLTVRTAGRGLSPNRVRAYRADVAAVAAELAGPADGGDDRPTGERVTVDQLTPDAVVRALAALQRAGRSLATRARIHGTLAGLCAHLVHQGQLRVDPLVAAEAAEAPEVPPPLRRARHRDRPSPDLARTPDPAGRRPWPERDLALAAVLAGTGARASEVCGVHIRDLVLDVDDPLRPGQRQGRRGARLPAPTRPSVPRSRATRCSSRNPVRALPWGAAVRRVRVTKAWGKTLTI